MKNLFSLRLFLCSILSLFILSATGQTSYTWDGSTDTDFATADNWTPSGVPGSGDNITIVSVTNQPVLDGNRTVNNLTMTSGTLRLAGYDLTVNGTATLNGGTITNGSYVMTTGSVNFNGTTMDCTVDVDAAFSGIHSTTFKKHTSLALSTGCYIGGNVFEDTTFISSSYTSYTYMGHTNPDTCLAPITFSIDAGIFILSYNAQNNYYADKVVLNNHSTSTGSGYWVGGSSGATTLFDGDIEMNVDSTAGFIKFYSGTNEHNGQLLIGEDGYHSGDLLLKAYTQLAANSIDLSVMNHNATITLGTNLTLEGDLICPALNTVLNTGCHFKGDVTIPKLVTWKGAIFEGKTVLGLPGSVSTGGNVFQDTTVITSTNTTYTYMGHTTPDTSLAPITFNIESGVFIVSYFSQNNYFADKVTLNNHGATGATGYWLGGSSTATTLFNDDIEMNVDSTGGFIKFYSGTNEHNGLLRIGEDGYHAGTLVLDHYTQTASGTIDLSDMDNTSSLSVQTNADITADFVYAGTGTATLNGATFRGNVDIAAPSLPVTNCDFHGTTTLEKTGTSNNLNGGNMFRGSITIENSSSSNYLYWGNTNPDTVLGDLTLINRSSQPLWMNYGTTGQYGGDITLDGDSLSVIRFGSSTAGRVAVFDGSTDQSLTVLEPDLDIQAYRIKVHKTSGRLRINNDLAVSYELSFTDGIVECQNNAVITLKDGVEPAATDSSYVEGAVRKIGNDAYSFPIGSNGHYRPISISAPGSVTDAFIATHINQNSDPTYDHGEKEGTLNRIGTNEYWSLSRDIGSSDVTVSLSWDDMSCGFDTLANLRVVAWEDTIWYNLGNGGTIGNAEEGSIQSNGSSSYYGVFALATIDTFDCVPCRADAGEDVWKFPGQSAVLGSDSVSGSSYAWSPASEVNQSTWANPKSTCTNRTSYKLIVTNANGCSSSDEVEVVVGKAFTCGFDETSFGISRSSCTCSGNITFDPNDPNTYEVPNRFQDFPTYIPNGTTDFIPVKTVSINIHVLKSAAGFGNFNTSDEAFLLSVIDALQDRYSTNASPSDPVLMASQELSDSYIRFDVNEVYFHHTSLWHADGHADNLNDLYDYLILQEGVDVLNHINIFLSTSAHFSGASGVGFPPYCVYDPNGDPWNYGTIMLFNSAQGFQPNWSESFLENYRQGIANLLAHEMGHALGLGHTYDASGNGSADYCDPNYFDYLYDLYNVLGCPHDAQHNGDPWMSPDLITNNIMGGTELYQEYYSPGQVGIMHRALSMNVQRYVTTCSPATEPVEIEEDEEWNFEFRTYNNVIVRADNTLTIKCTVRMPNDATIIVEPGAKLIVDGGTITAACDMWQGIQVQGVAGLAQSPYAGGSQGVVELKNGAIIENAVVGIDLIDHLASSDAGGGVVIAEGSTIQNCRKGVAFGPYRSSTGNISSFEDMVFLCDEPLPDVTAYGGQGTSEFVTIWGTDGIEFTNCTFQFDYESPKFITQLAHNQWPTGINSAYAGFTLKDDSGDENGNDFINLQNGVVSYSLWGIRDHIHSQYSTFTNVSRGIFLAGCAYPRIVHGNHQLTDWDNAYQIPSYGFMGNLNWAYQISDNHYAPMSGTNSQIGVIADGSTANSFFTINSGHIANNQFDDIWIGTQTEENNLVVQISCNEYDGNDIDWFLNPIEPGNLEDQGTGCVYSAPPQPTDEERAGNEFQNTVQPYNIYDFGLEDISYYYAATGSSNLNQLPLTPNSGNLDVEPCIVDLADPSCTSGTLNPHDLDAKRYQTHQNWLAKMDDLDTLISHVDSSQTQLMLDTISNLNTNDTVLRDVLIAHSPLSDTVLITYINRDTIMTAANFQSVMLQNVPASKHVWEVLETMFTGYKDEWLAVADTLLHSHRRNPGVVTATSLEREIRFYGGLTHRYADQLVMHYVDNDAVDSAKAYMDTVSLYPLRVVLLGTELSDRNWDEADSSLAKLPLITINDSAVYDLFSILIELGRDTLTILDISSSDSLRVRQIAADTTLDASVLAKGILTILLDTMYFEQPEVATGLPSERLAGPDGNQEESVSPTETNYFKVYPNPFEQTTTIEYDLGVRCQSGCQLYLYDLRGRIILTEMIKRDGGKGKVIVELSEEAGGLYYCALYRNNSLLQTEKLILVK